MYVYYTSKDAGAVIIDDGANARGGAGGLGGAAGAGFARYGSQGRPGFPGASGVRGRVIVIQASTAG